MVRYKDMEYDEGWNYTALQIFEVLLVMLSESVLSQVVWALFILNLIWAIID